MLILLNVAACAVLIPVIVNAILPPTERANKRLAVEIFIMVAYTSNSPV